MTIDQYGNTHEIAERSADMVNTLTLNPAVDRILFLDSFVRNVTNRIRRREETIGGKGTHVSVNLSVMGMPSRAYGISHGETGRKISAYLEAAGVEDRFLHLSGAEGRTNYLLVEDTGDCTLITEPGVAPDDESLAALFSAMERELCPGDCLVLSGDSSNCAPSAYRQLLGQVGDRELFVFLDASGEALVDFVRTSPYLIKPNLDELSFLCGRTVTADPGDVIRAMDSLDAFNVDVLAVSLGGKGSIVRDRTGVYQAVAPDVRVVNTIGCGDCFLAGLVYGFCHGYPMEESLRYATGCSSAAAEGPGSAGFDPGRAELHRKRTAIKKLRES